MSARQCVCAFFRLSSCIIRFSRSVIVALISSVVLGCIVTASSVVVTSSNRSGNRALSSSFAFSIRRLGGVRSCERWHNSFHVRPTSFLDVTTVRPLHSSRRQRSVCSGDALRIFAQPNIVVAPLFGAFNCWPISGCSGATHCDRAAPNSIMKPEPGDAVQCDGGFKASRVDCHSEEEDEEDIFEFNPDNVRHKLHITFLHVPVQILQSSRKILKRFVFNRRGIRPIVSDKELTRVNEAAITSEAPHGSAVSYGDSGALANPATSSSSGAEYGVSSRADRQFKYILLSPEIDSNLGNLPREIASYVRNNGIAVGICEVTVGYENMSVGECLATFLPSSCEVPHRFETIGHIAHLNLRKEHRRYRFAIGKVILDKHSHLRTVINKLGIARKWRELEFELLAGDRDYVAHLKENALHFDIDVSRVYWNSRLSNERQHILQVVPCTAVVYDVFAGVGAFSIFLARKGCVIAANDGNLVAVEYLKTNSHKNNVSALIEPYNLDGREFIRQAFSSESLTRLWNKKLELMQSTRRKHLRVTGSKLSSGEPASAECRAEIFESAHYAVVDNNGTDEISESSIEVHVIMNLPESAIDFLDAFRGRDPIKIGVEECMDKSSAVQKRIREQPEIQRIRIHCYGFSRSDPPEAELRPRVEAALGRWPESTEVREVRDVAPNKKMFCLSFDLNDKLLGNTQSRREGVTGPIVLDGPAVKDYAPHPPPNE